MPVQLHLAVVISKYSIIVTVRFKTMAWLERSRYCRIYLLLVIFFLEETNCQNPESAQEHQNGPCPLPSYFPPTINLKISSFETVNGETKLPFVYLAIPRNEEEVILIANWAYLADFRVRAIGSKQSWSPLIFSTSDSGHICPKFILVDTTKHFTGMQLDHHQYPENSASLHSVTVGSGVKLQKLLEFLESRNLGLFSCPSMGAVTVGGMLATGAHGSGVPSPFDRKSRGHSYGTFSNLVLDMTIVAWNEDKRSYEVKKILRVDPEAKAFLTNLGRTLVTAVTLRVGENQMLRSQSHFMVPVREVFAHPEQLSKSKSSNPNQNQRSLSQFLETYGRMNIVGLGTSRESPLWVITWKAEPLKPQKSRRVFTPYNFYFMNYFPKAADPYLKNLLNVPLAWRAISALSPPAIMAGTTASMSRDYWGPSKNHLLYFTPYQARQRPNPYVVVTSRSNLQLVAHIMRSHFEALAKEHNHPALGEFSVRVSGLDDPKDVEIPGAESPSFSNARPLPEYPEFDVVLWFEFSAYTDTPMAQHFATRLQELYYRDIHGKLGILRVEWSKGWGHTELGAWTNQSIIDHFPRVFSSSEQLGEWNSAVEVLDRNDPHRIFSNEFLDELLRKR